MERMTADGLGLDGFELEVYDADEVDREIKRLREALDAAEKVVEAAREVPLDDQYGPDIRLGQALAEYDKLKEEK